MHTFGFIHKNVRPENIFILKGLKALIRHVYLIKFEYFRAVEGNISRLNDTA
jgi:hypothetical protein